MFNQLKRAAKVNFAFGFVLQNLEDGIYKCFNANENNTVMETSKLVCTHDDMVNLKKNYQKMDIVDHCTREIANTKWKLYIWRIALLLKILPMDRKNTVLSGPF